MHWSTIPEAITGTQGVEKVRIRNTADGSIAELPCTGFFAYVGLAPNSEFLSAAVGRDAAGAVITDDSLMTAVSGVWAAGAVRAGYSGRLTDAVKEAETTVAGALKRINS